MKCWPTLSSCFGTHPNDATVQPNDHVESPSARNARLDARVRDLELECARLALAAPTGTPLGAIQHVAKGLQPGVSCLGPTNPRDRQPALPTLSDSPLGVSCIEDDEGPALLAGIQAGLAGKSFFVQPCIDEGLPLMTVSQIAVRRKASLVRPCICESVSYAS